MNTDEVKYNEATNLFVYTASANNVAITSDPTATIAIYDSSMVAILAATAMTWDDTNKRLTYTLDTTTVGDWPVSTVGDWYRAKISWTASSVVQYQWPEFAVVKEPWKSNVTATDIENESPMIDELQDDTTTTFVTEIANAEWAMRIDLREDTIPLVAGMIVDKDALNNALKYKVLARLWSRVDPSGDTALYYTNKYMTRLNGAKGRLSVDLDQDEITDGTLDNTTHLLMP